MPPQTPGYYGFEQALQWLKAGRKITRRGWSGKGQFIYLTPETQIEIGGNRDTDKLVGVYSAGSDITCADRIDMRYANGKIGAWSISHDDLLQQDWQVLM